MEDPTCDIHDWEVVLQGEEEDEEFITNSSASSVTSAAELAADEGGVIHSDYFTLNSPPQHNNNNYYVGGGGDTAAAAVSESSVDSDNPSWVDPSDNIALGDACRKRSRSRNSNSSSSESSTVDQENLLSLIGHHSGCGCGAHPDFSVPNELGMSSLGQSFTGEFHDASEGEEQQHGVVVGDDGVLGLRSEEEKERGSKAKGKEEKRVVWWKVPMEVLRYCITKVGPVWSLSVAAAVVMGLVILRRRYHLYKLKRKAMGIQLKVTVDDKKVSQFMTRAARLNEAFSVVKRVPNIRPALPAPGMVPWPVVSMR